MNAFHWRGPSTVQIEQPPRGRPRLDITDEERAQRHREAALRWHHRNKQFRHRDTADLSCGFVAAGMADREALHGTV
ncbi:MAG: hypothetical protein KDJ45_12145 [Hyphomicrobiaceae bacterium]|nr:hypothetical protein [Hyphomicrobiaceae bacterium]